MAHSLPVVAIASGGIPEVVEDGKNGLLMKDLDPGAFSDAITNLISDPNKANRLGKVARETIVTRFSATQMVEETVRLYEILVTRDR
jgi:glycosyltransferase involved in cell wall biosynthesis